ncbi:hypothetical protein ACLOAV_005506 [Pseudogymnoascus australis]
MDDGRSQQILAVSISFLVPSWVLVLLRCYVRIWVKRFFGADDYLAVASLYFFLAELAYVVSTLLIKLSICVFLLRIAISRYQILILRALSIIQLIFGIFFFFFLLFQCSPISYFWERLHAAGHPGGGSCHTRAVIKAAYAHAANVCLGDLTLAILPLFIVWNMTLHRRTKISVAVLLAFGSIASVATIARFPYLGHLNDAEDLPYAITDITIWAVVEVGMAIIASAIPTLRPLMGKVRILGLSSGSRESQGRRGSSRVDLSVHE